jgi:hypothetical protein
MLLDIPSLVGQSLIAPGNEKVYSWGALGNALSHLSL